MKQNPLAFEMNTKYVAKLASLVFTNRYFEFVQSDSFVDLEIVAQTKATGVETSSTAAQSEKPAVRSETSKLLSAFD